MYIKTKELPRTLQRVLERLGYHKPDIEVKVQESRQPYHGSGAGTRAFMALVDLATGKFDIRYGSWGGPNMFVPTEPPDDGHAPELPLPPNGAMILGCSGNYMYATVYISPLTAAPLLPAAPTLTKEEAVALYCVKGLRGGTPRRECWQHFGIRPATLDRLVAQQLLKRDARGSIQITTAGKNALSAQTAWQGYNPPYDWKERWSGDTDVKRPDDYYGRD